MSDTKNFLHKLFGVDFAAHGDSKAEDDANVNLEVLSLGLSRTGTTSLAEAFEILGLGPSHGGVTLVREPWRNEAWIDFCTKVNNGVWKAGDQALNDRLTYLTRGFRSSTDNPMYQYPAVYVQAYPNAKFILTVRDGGAASWWKSFDVLMVHLRNDWARTIYCSLTYPIRFMRRLDVLTQLYRQDWNKRFGCIDASMYDKHNENVRQVVPSEKLLVYNIKEGWEPLCKFLGKPVPEQPFPHLNDGKAMKAIYVQFQVFGAVVWMLYLCSAAGLGYLALKPNVALGLLHRGMDLIAGFGRRLGYK